MFVFLLKRPHKHFQAWREDRLCFQVPSSFFFFGYPSSTMRNSFFERWYFYTMIYGGKFLTFFTALFDVLYFFPLSRRTPALPHPVFSIVSFHRICDSLKEPTRCHRIENQKRFESMPKKFFGRFPLFFFKGDRNRTYEYFS